MGAIDSGRWLRASRHLDEALDLSPQARDAYLVALRDVDPETASDLEAMLAEHRALSAEGFLDAAPPMAPPEGALAGMALGAYTLISPIGHGGMGSVWLASRSDGRFEGEVAVKLLNAALVGRGGEERFRREGTILARLAHPHIARLLDAGVSGTGQPYLVLELVKGRHIDAYCDQARLSVEARVRLFLDVQAAVAHAHANLIVHRDLKPSNVLVTADGRVKLLDFSIAKLIDDEGVSRLTREEGSALTPKYAAPEQVVDGPVTTATDVYALGVLLYELLSGHHPAGDTPRSSAEFTRAIVENEPIRLSAAGRQASGERDAAGIAAERSTTPERLERLLRGDLDTILGKALKRDAAERYASVAEFADDLRRYIEHQPIRARPDALGYRAAKFVRRRWRGVAATAVAGTVLAALVGFHTVRLAAERDRAQLEAEKASRVSELLTGVLTSADPYRTPGAEEPTVGNLLDAGADRIARELSDQPALQAELFTVVGRTYQRMGIHEKALPLLEQALRLGRQTLGSEHARVAQSLNDLGVLHREMGGLEVAESLLGESLALRRRLPGIEPNELAITLVEFARVLNDRGRLAESEAPIREALAIRTRALGDEHRETATSKNELALLLWDLGDLAGAEPLLRQNVATSERLLGPDHPNVASAKANLGLVLIDRGEPAAAEVLLRESVRITRQVFGPGHREYAFSLPGLAISLEVQGRLDEARALLEEALAIARPQLGDDHPRVIGATLDRSRIQIARGEAAATEQPLRRALEVSEQLYARGDWRIARAQSLLGAALLAQGRHAEAETLMLAADEAFAAAPGRHGRRGRYSLANRARLATLYRDQGREQQAAAFR